MHIGIAGNIGSGKTTLTRLLAAHYGWTPRYEAVTYNPYLDDYYRDISRWAFNMEVFFLKERFRDIMDIRRSPGTIIQDRTIYEGVHVFVANNRRMGHLSDRDYEAYMELYRLMTDLVSYPDLMIYLRASIPHLVGNIQKRARECEQSIPIDYLTGLNNLYEDFIYNQYKGRVLTVEVDGLDYEHRPADLAAITDKIDSLLYGLFPINEQTTNGENPKNNISCT
ncbi:MAG: deoxynucleoside kinase [Bacteroidaceae bacterium]|nr:deoxynucleoside kinase [Bacteroidaceae bacterium]